ncbi:hypothetical protein JRO89_XSUnG0110700 [Xanthoceras sorbifolium]|uniref:non-specific serine/threonine protein kinase n=1 Tax=Xanthoceras sorbifolium TaxID=99658 RepID=A0ABQ8GYI4_9ROSI|nr:hypothetical protein JRO89_XSUnG0110700 [Xanthoceras sorbifolium]
MEPGTAPPPPPPPPPSQTAFTLLNKYQMGRLLGRGSFAKVHQARSIVDGSVVAVKIIKKDKSLDPEMESRIVREVAAMRRLQHHPNVLKIQEVMATKSKIYLVMEYASGGELFAKVLRRGRLTESAARRYFQQLVSALHFCHQNGVAHRDVKPQNLLLDQNGNLKVSDFGLSALPEQLKNGLLHTACGTPAYTAPEVVCRKGYDGAKADAWSCGVILFARSIIFQLLDPNPNTRMSIEALMNLSWFKKSLQLKQEQESYSFLDPNLETTKDGKLDSVPMNAFDIISLSSGLNLSGLFEAQKRKERRFTTTEKVERVVERVREIGEKMGYRVERGKSGGVVGLGKLGKAMLLAEILEIAPEMFVVELKVVAGGLEFEEPHWEDLQVGLQDIVLSWHNTDVI